MIKILIIHTIYQQKGGEDAVVANEIALLQAIGEQVELLQFSNQRGTLLKLLQLPFNYAAYRRTIKTIETLEPDVVHIHNLHFAASASVIRAVKKTGIPLVITLHNYRLLCPSATLFHQGQLFTNNINQLFSWKAVARGVYQHSVLLTFWLAASQLLHQWLGTWNLADRYIVLGRQTKELFDHSKLRQLGPKMIVKPNFCYRTSLPVQFKRNYYCYLGRLSEEKGIDTLLQAFADNKLPLKIAGDGPMAAQVRDYSERYANIDFLGRADKQQATDLLAAAEALLFPSEWYEPFGMVIIEAFAAGTPVIASAIGEARYLIKHQYNGLHFQAGNPEDLQKQLAYFQQLPEIKKMTYQKNARASYEAHYTPEKNAAQLLAAYSQAIAQSKYNLKAVRIPGQGRKKG